MTFYNNRKTPEAAAAGDSYMSLQTAPISGSCWSFTSVMQSLYFDRFHLRLKNIKALKVQTLRFDHMSSVGLSL